MTDEVPEQPHAEKLATVIGKNARTLRKDAGLTLDQVSVAARTCGLSWSESRVADFERGKVAPNLETLIAVCLALADAGCDEAMLPELLRSETPIQINESLFLSSDQVVDLISRRRAWNPGELTAALNASWEHFKASGLLAAVAEVSGATEERTRKALGITREELADLSAALWNRTFSEERDRRAGEGANAQKLGQISRQLRKELQAALEAATHGDNQ